MRAPTTIGVSLCAVVCLFGLATAHVAADTSSDVSCYSLTMHLSDDKNYYIFDASAGGDAGNITGYKFDFGDHQSYNLTLSALSNTDHHSATVTHTYQTAGTYTAKVRVNTKSGGRAAGVESPGCQTTVTIPPAGTELPNTGIGNVVSLFVGLSLSSTVLHHLWTRRRFGKWRDYSNVA